MRKLRLILTSTCNYNCFFCHHEGLQKKNLREEPLESVLNASDYAYLYKTFKELYFSNEITITGGEPLLHKDVFDILKALKEENAKTLLVTNGSLLERFYQVAEYTDRINISLHSLRPEIYSSVVGLSSNALNQVVLGIKKVVSQYPNVQIRLNTPVTKGINDDVECISCILDFAKSIKGSVQFIELFPKTAYGFVPLADIEPILQQCCFTYTPADNGQAIYSRDDGVKVVLTRCFCAHAERMENPSLYCKENQDLFITPSGGIKTCMNTSNEILVVDAVKNRDMKSIARQFENAINQICCPSSKRNG